ncbi:hypothetical protein [Streptomyces sp. 2A115]|uniref:hypothetical protein n=1 Tax=Streptomyces sp. 2A115 TaxID=3457439 RepID=UPI003FD2C723
MSADRETNHDMTHSSQSPHGSHSPHSSRSSQSDIALLLAEAADEVDIGIAPYQAVVRGGRRRKARRWAVASAAALVIAGSTGSLALAGAMGSDGKDRGVVATQPPTAEERHVYQPRRTTLATGTEKGKEWRISVEVWGAPKDEAEAERQWAAMGLYGVRPTGTREAEDLIGKGWMSVHLRVGEEDSTVSEGAVEKGDTLSGKDLESYAVPLEVGGTDRADASQRLVIGKVAPTARRVTCTWDDGTSTNAVRPAPGTEATTNDTATIRPVEGSQPNWFVCLAPEGVASDVVQVTG